MTNFSELITKIVISAFAATGLIEFLKNIIKTKKTWIYVILMPIVAIACYCTCEYLPTVVIGCILTIGMVQLCYQIIVQGFKTIVKGFINKSSGKDNE